MPPETDVNVKNGTYEKKISNRRESTFKLSARKQSIKTNHQLHIPEPITRNSAQGTDDITFEPTIEMLVDDFDDEQTLNEEEALASLESDYQDEVATLKEESEMPIEQLLAKYNFVSHSNASKKRESSTSLLRAPKQVKVNHSEEDTQTSNQLEADTKCVKETPSSNREIKNENAKPDQTTRQKISKRSYLLDLYPDEIIMPKTVATTENTLNDNDIESESSEEIEVENDCIKKIIMVGPAHQAIIPEGLSKYGDILPYENEDKLIWEPSQVSEHEVECYLGNFLKTKEDKHSTQGKEISEQSYARATEVTQASIRQEVDELACTNKVLANDSNGVIKDNEQALHLLVQCGYDFKEALRRKQLNAVPLTGPMSLWSENECKKFEEGIQKYGKDFLKIRQNEIRTRSMREIVQFYYLWKKSERRDHDFANTDTVDHMEIFLNEGCDYSPNASTGLSSVMTCVNAHNTSDSVQRNISIFSSSGINSDKRKHTAKGGAGTPVPNGAFPK